MLVLVAGQTLSGFQLRPFVNDACDFFLAVHGGVAFGAAQSGMLADKFIVGVFFMVELKLFFPRFERVTGDAVFFSPVAFKEMHIIFFVAAHAGGLSSKVTNLSGSR